MSAISCPHPSWLMRSWALTIPVDRRPATPFSSGQLYPCQPTDALLAQIAPTFRFWSITRIFDSQSLSSTSQLGPTSFWTAPSISQLGLTIFVNHRHVGQCRSGRLAFAVLLNRRIKSPTPKRPRSNWVWSDCQFLSVMLPISQLVSTISSSSADGSDKL